MKGKNGMDSDLLMLLSLVGISITAYIVIMVLALLGYFTNCQ